MIAFVANAVWASIAGIAISLLVAGAVAAIVRVQRPSASTRCLLWFVALAMCALAPAAIFGTMLVRGAAQPALVSNTGGYVPIVLPHALHIENDNAHPTFHAIARVSHKLRRAPSLSERAARVIAAIWALGSLVGLLGLARGIVRVRALKARSSPLDAMLVDDLPWLTETPGREIYLRLSYEIETPIAVGFRRPVILIPTDMATIDGLRAIEPLVIHEYAHLARYDDWTNLAQRLIERIVWFNPLVWVLGRRLALEREVAADDAVVARTNDAKNYATTLWRMAREMRMPEHVVVAPGAMLTRKQISVRIERLLEETRARRPQLGTAFAVFAAGATTVVAVAATAPPILALPPLSPLPTLSSLPPIPAVPALPRLSLHLPDLSQLPSEPLVTPSLAPASPAPALPARSPAPRERRAATTTRPQAVAAPPLGTPLPAALQAEVDHAAARARDALQRSAAFVPHPLPSGELTREMVAACRSCNFRDRDLSGLDLSNLQFEGAVFDRANVSGTSFAGTQLVGVSMRGTNLSDADFTNARIIGSHFDGANFSGTTFKNVVFVASTIDWSALHGTGSPASVVDGCEGCNFQDADLHGEDLRGMRLDGANFQSANLRGVDFRGAQLTGANFQDANLDQSDLRDATLAGANLSGASMNGTKTAGARLTGATLP